MIEKINDKLFSWASILEDNTRAQAEMAASMPFIFPHVALMPDAHLGRGATVGSVLPTDGAIIPAAVGVDIGCVDADTEYLSPQGWRRIADYDGGEVMQYDPETGEGRFVAPEAYIVKDCPEFLRLRTKYGIDQMLSPDHRVLIWKIVGRPRRRVPTVMTAEEFATEHDRLAQGFKAEFTTTFAPRLDTQINLSDDEIRVQVMVHADAHVERERAVVRVKKERKVRRARKLLTAAKIEWTERVRDGVTDLRFTPPRTTKTYAGDWWECSAEQLAVIADEVLHWDGNLDDRVYYTRDQASADFIHYVFTATGSRAVLRADRHPDGAIDYRVFSHPNTMVGMGGVPKTPITRESSADGRAYCFTVPSGFWVMRRGGNIAMTGNCGMLAVLTQFTRADLEGTDLRVLHESISRRIPLGAGRYNTKIQPTAEPRIAELEAAAVNLGFDPRSYAGNWRLQLGSLGSGNHFIEVTIDELDRVWLFLHSGSRGVGNKIASVHIKIAKALMKQWWITLPDPDLAYLVEGTDNFWAYITEMQWAQRFAWLNRDEMMDRVVEALTRHLGQDVERVETIGCHHNYTEKETHFGRKVWLSRKGAIDASAGVRGLIPGSMGTESFVVTGLGNPVALRSSPHGAGRNFSRGAARRKFTRESLDAAMAGVTWGESDAFLDEHPEAYKDVQIVMADAADLVRVDHTLRQLINVKGT